MPRSVPSSRFSSAAEPCNTASVRQRVAAVVDRRGLRAVEMASRHHIERVGAHPAANPAFERRPYAAVEIGPLGRHVRIVGDLVVGQIAHPPVGVGDLMSPVVGGAYAAGHLLARRQRGIIAPVPFARDALGVAAVERIGGPTARAASPCRSPLCNCGGNSLRKSWPRR